MGFKVDGLNKLSLNFVAFCEACGATRVRNDLAVQWATARIKVPVSDALFARRMDAVRIFARYQYALDPATEVPAEVICRRRYRPKEPNVFSQAEIRALLAASDMLSPRFKALTWHTLIGLLAATGMRPGEACRLTLSDIDLTNGVIEVVQTKFGKSRLVFVHRAPPPLWPSTYRPVRVGSGPPREPAQPCSSTADAGRSTRTHWALPSSGSSPLPI